MANQIINDQITNGATVGINLLDSADFTIIANCENVTPPDQSYNTVEAKLLNAQNGISPRFLGSRNGGDLTFKINVVDGDDAGLLMLLTAYEGKVPCQFQITYPSGAKRTIPDCKVQKCSATDHSVDAVLAYDVSVVVNGLMTITEASVQP